MKTIDYMTKKIDDKKSFSTNYKSKLIFRLLFDDSEC